MGRAKNALIVGVVTTAMIVTAFILYTFVTVPKQSVPEPIVTNGPNGQINQVRIRIQCQTEWAGIYGQTNSTQLIIPNKQFWNGTGDSSITLIRPQYAKPWVIVTIMQGFWYSTSGNVMTISILSMDGTILKTQSAGGRSGQIVELNVNIDNLASNVTYNPTMGTIDLP